MQRKRRATFDEDEDDPRSRSQSQSQSRPRVRWAPASEADDERDLPSPPGTPPRHLSPRNRHDPRLPPLYQPDESDDEDALPNRILAIHAPSQFSVAAAYYDSTSRRLKVLEDTKDTWAWDLVVLLCEQYLPTQVLVSANAMDSLLKVIDEFCIEHPETSCVALPPREFQHTMAQYRLANVHLPRNDPVLLDENGDVMRESQEVEEDEAGAGMGRMRLSLLKMGCRVNVDAPAAVSAAGALIAHVVRQESTEAHTDESSFQLNGIESMDIEEHMFINQDALTSLAVFSVEGHASRFSDERKQALSLRSVLDTTITALGRKMFNTWLLRPLTNKEAIESRLNVVQALSRGDMAGGRKELRKDLKGFGNVLTACNKIKTGKGTWRDWKGLVFTLTSGRAIKETLVNMTFHTPLDVTAKISQYLNEDVQLFLSDVVAIIDWDLSSDENRVCVRPGIDDDIDRRREEYAGLEPLLNQMSLIVSRNVPPGMCEDVKVIYLPQLGCLVAASNIYRRDYIPMDWVESFEAQGLTYFKTPQMVNLDDHYGDLQNIIIDIEIEWVQRLIERLEPLEYDLMGLSEAIAEVDCLLSFALAVERFGFKRPVIVEEPVLKIKNGWHPLHAMCVPQGQYIPNDTALAGGEGYDLAAMTVVTGANGSGKSAYGKQIALITYMAHIGCFVPADLAEIGICDKIFTRVQTRESASKTASAFMIDLGQVSQALRGATSRSLLILDEFGKGTSPSDGAGLLAGVVSHLVNGPNPRTVILTHFHEIFAQNLIDRELPIIQCHMKSIVVDDSNTPTYLYKVTPNLSLSSNAAECALTHGISEEVVERAREVSHRIANFQITSLIDAQLTDADKEEMALHEELAKRFLNWDLDDDEMDVLGELELLVASINPDEGDRVESDILPGESSRGYSALERSVVIAASMAGDAGFDGGFD